MAEWPLVGRSPELARLQGMTTRLDCPGVVLAAPAGCGKTRLAREVLHAAEHAGIATFVATASQSAADVPLGAMVPMLSAFGGVAASGEDPSSFLQRVVSHLVARAGNRRLFVLVDDAHLLDPASAALVHQLAAHQGVFLLLTLRTREPAPDAVTALWKDGLLERIDLEDLGAGALEHLLSTVLGGPVDGAAVTELIARSQGNMLFLRELVTAALADRTLREEHGLWRLVGEATPSDRLVELVEARLGRLGSDQRRLLELLAVGEPVGMRELSTLSTVEIADGLEDLGLVSSRNDGQRLEVRLAHPLYGEVLRSRLSGLQSRRLARELAECVESAGMRRRTDVLRVGTWRLAGGGGRPELLLSAAAEARWQLDLGLALRLATAARAAGAGLDASLLTAQLLVLHGRPAEADGLLEQLCAETEGRDQIRATLARLDVAYMRYRPKEMRRLLEGIGPVEDPDLQAAVQGRATVAAMLLEGTRSALDITGPPLDHARGDDVLPTRLARALCLVRLGRVRSARQEIEAVDAALPTFSHLGWWRFPYSSVASEVMTAEGRLGGCIEDNLGRYHQGLRVGSAELQLFSAWTLSAAYVRAGRLQAAAKFGQEAIALAEQLGHDSALHCCLHLLALINAQSGMPAQARETLERHDQLNIATTPYSRGLVGEARAWAAIAAGDVRRCMDELEATAETCSAEGDVVAAASALHGMVRMGHATAAVDRLEDLAAEVDGPWEPLFARHARAVADHDSRGLEAVSAEFHALGAVLFAAEAAGDACAAWQRAADSRRATATQHLAAGLAEKCEGAVTPALQGLNVRDQLTRAELETARYAAAGHSNKAIAEQLQLSVRTVEARLQSAYHKLGVRRRTDLAAAMMTGPGRADDAT